jgi:hypothetical protein
MIWHGYSSALSVQKLPDIDAELLSDSLWNRAGSLMTNRGCFILKGYVSHEYYELIFCLVVSEGSQQSLLLVLFWRLKWSLLAPVFPYLIVVASQLAQPYLISAVLGYVGSTYDGSQYDRDIGYGLIAAYGMVYLCIALSDLFIMFSPGFSNLHIDQRCPKLGCNCLGAAFVLSVRRHVERYPGGLHI